MEEKIRKLPKWAQEHIKSLEIKINNQDDLIKNLKYKDGLDDEDAESIVWLQPSVLHWNSYIPLDISASLFISVVGPIKRNRLLHDCVQASYSTNRDVVEITCENMIVKPIVSNVIQIRKGK